MNPMKMNRIAQFTFVLKASSILTKTKEAGQSK